MFCPRCRDPYREGFDWCPDCEVALVETLPDEPRRESPEVPAAAVLPEVAPTDPRAEKLRLLELGLVLFVAFGYSLVASLHHVWRGSAHGTRGAGGDPLWHAVEAITASVPAICVLLYVLRAQGRGLRDLGVTARWSDLGLGVAVVVGCMLLGLGVAVAAVTVGGRAVLSQWHWHPPSLRSEVLAPLTLLGILCAAAKEELLVRAYMMSEVLDLTGSAFLAVASSTCLQGLYHLYQGRLSALAAASSFLVYSVFYWKTRRATPLVIAHFLHNLWLDLIQRG